jgi:hypothetical protein
LIRAGRDAGERGEHVVERGPMDNDVVDRGSDLV